VAEYSRTVAETVAGNVRTYRQLRGFDQARLARRMQSLGIEWRQVTVSEVERNQRNVSATELFALAYALETTIDQLYDTRGPERIRGPRLSFIDILNSPGTVEVEDGGEIVDRRVPTLAIPPQDVTAFVCAHKAYPVALWDDDNIRTENLSPRIFHEELRS